MSIPKASADACVSSVIAPEPLTSVSRVDMGPVQIRFTITTITIRTATLVWDLNRYFFGSFTFITATVMMIPNTIATAIAIRYGVIRLRILITSLQLISSIRSLLPFFEMLFYICRAIFDHGHFYPVFPAIIFPSPSLLVILYNLYCIFLYIVVYFIILIIINT